MRAMSRSEVGGVVSDACKLLALAVMFAIMVWFTREPQPTFVNADEWSSSEQAAHVEERRRLKRCNLVNQVAPENKAWARSMVGADCPS